MADPDVRAGRASVVWLPHLNPATVVVAPAPDEFTDAHPIELTPAFSWCGTNGEHWLLNQGGDALPIALLGGADPARPSAVMIPLDSSFSIRVEAASCLLNAITDGAPGRAPDGLTAQQRSRLGLMLRSLDGRRAHCSYREIAEVLFGANSVPAGRAWSTHDLRGRTRRLCNRGRDLMRGGYIDLLRNPRQFRS